MDIWLERNLTREEIVNIKLPQPTFEDCKKVADKCYILWDCVTPKKMKARWGDLPMLGENFLQQHLILGRYLFILWKKQSIFVFLNQRCVVVWPIRGEARKASCAGCLISTSVMEASSAIMMILAIDSVQLPQLLVGKTDKLI